MGAPRLDPDLREVLEDLVANGPADGYFAKLRPARIGRIFRAPQQPVSIAQAGFSSLERHLIHFHREQLALVLRQAFLHGFYQDHPRPVCIEQLPGTEQLARRSREAIQLAEPSAFTYRSGHYLQRILRGEPITSPNDQISMLVASMRLDNHAHAHFSYAQAHLSQGEIGTTRATLSPFMAPSLPGMACSTNALWSEALLRAGDPRQADRFVVRGIELGRKEGFESRAAYLAAGLLIRAVIGETSMDVRQALELSPAKSAVKAFVAAMRVQAEDHQLASRCALDKVDDWLEQEHYEF